MENLGLDKPFLADLDIVVLESRAYRIRTTRLYKKDSRDRGRKI